MGKVVILRSILLARTAEELRVEWRDYRSHTKKNVHWILLELFKKGARKLDDFRPVFDPQGDHGRFLESVKQACFYSAVSTKSGWSWPELSISPEFAKVLFAVAKALVPQGVSPMTSEAELKLWVKHLQPVWKGSMAEMKKAVAVCYAEAEARGLLPTNSTASMLDFLHSGSGPLTQ